MKLGCYVCDHENDVEEYRDFDCENCGQRHVYEEGHMVVLTDNQKSILVAEAGQTKRLAALHEAAIAAAKADGVVSSNYASARAVWALWWAERDRIVAKVGGVP